MNETFVLAQISDMHVGAGPACGGRDAAQGLADALALVRTLKPDAIIATGDLVNDAKAHEYERLAALLADAPAPLYLVPGNHDDAALIRTHFPAHAYLPPDGPLSYTIEEHAVRIVALDDTILGEVAGYFDEAHARWLDAALAAAPDRPTILALHHPPFASHDLLFDTMGLKRADLLRAVVARHPQVIRIVCGHHHRMIVGALAHAPVIVAPSTAWTYSLALREEDEVARRTPEPCGVLLHVWRPGQGLATHFFES